MGRGVLLRQLPLLATTSGACLPDCPHRSQRRRSALVKSRPRWLPAARPRPAERGKAGRCRPRPGPTLRALDDCPPTCQNPRSLLTETLPGAAACEQAGRGVGGASGSGAAPAPTGQPTSQQRPLRPAVARSPPAAPTLERCGWRVGASFS